MSEAACRMCGCTEESACVDEWGDACGWSASDPSICTFCDEGVPCDQGGPANAGWSLVGKARSVS